MTFGFFDHNNARLYYETAGEGPALALLHAGICDSIMWDAQFYAFAEHYQVVRHDLRGFGRSYPAGGAFAHFDDLRALLDHLGIERATLLGCSMGGMTALDFALTCPDRVAGLILVGSSLAGYVSPDEDEAAPPEWEEAEKAYRMGDYERASEFEVRLWVDGPQRQPEQVSPALRDQVRWMNARNLRHAARKLGEERKLDPPAAARLSEIHAPALVIVGDLDQPEMIDIADLLAGQIAGAHKMVMHGAAHVPSMEQPLAFNRHVLDWLRRRQA